MNKKPLESLQDSLWQQDKLALVETKPRKHNRVYPGRPTIPLWRVLRRGLPTRAAARSCRADIFPPPRLAGRKMRRWWWWSRSRNVTGRAFQSIRLCEEPKSCGVGPTVACCEPGRHRQCEDRYPRPRGKQRRTAKRAGAGSENLRRLLLHQEHLFPIRWASSKAPVLLLRHASG